MDEARHIHCTYVTWMYVHPPLPEVKNRSRILKGCETVYNPPTAEANYILFWPFFQRLRALRCGCGRPSENAEKGRLRPRDVRINREDEGRRMRQADAPHIRMCTSTSQVFPSHIHQNPPGCRQQISGYPQSYPQMWTACMQSIRETFDKRESYEKAPL